MSSEDDSQAMAQALQLAERGRTSTHPNPRVGCVIVREGVIVGQGYHERAGLPHAEVMALRDAGERARGATVYVTLEPCCHTGRTPPCTDALLAAGVGRVVVAMEDPDPRVAGGGVARLRAAGLAVDTGVMEAAARALNRGFISRLTRRRPFVRAKVGASLDGRTALTTGESRWITSPEARADVQRLRAESSAIMTGIGTVMADNPALTVRPRPSRPPQRIIVDSRLRIADEAAVLRPASEAIVATVADTGPRAEGLRAAGVRVVAAGSGEGGVDLAVLMEKLAAMDINDLLVEAGPRLLASLILKRLVDELIVYMAPSLLGDGQPIAALRLACLAEQVRWRYVQVRQIGPDLRMVLSQVE
ncbi:MAG: bifunctional diaminohydroxyphosphoribosylaminopyrimidine deaminase/5-amino-6-(5-phosphoribosylamino)uracil reductase RibD [Gammaproteobacteria bacterium]|nr:bifunctional diaminohydroxyphosphoribosylaminopyrimidine deaminase/5-amino-6-(5-phosphoribosylamino)uracil reductase RibD [Gammaproteobacteria bacterium]